MNTFRKIFIFALLIGLMPISGAQVASATGTTTVLDSDVSYSGANWTSLALNTTTGTLIAVGAPAGNTSNLIARSTDGGASWTIPTLPAGEYVGPPPQYLSEPKSMKWRSIAYGNGVFVAVSDKFWNDAEPLTHQIVKSSDDGLTWVTVATPLQALWTDIVFANNMFVAISSESGKDFISSVDGITWSAITVPTLASGWKAITYGSGTFMALSRDGAIAKSTDGVTWATSSPTTLSMYDQFKDYQDITFGNGIFAVINKRAMSSSNASNTVYVSSDSGVSWTGKKFTTSVDSTINNNNFWSSITYNENMGFAAVNANDGTNGQYADKVLVSSDGAAWRVDYTNTEVAPQAVISTGTRFVAVGKRSNSNYSAFYFEPDTTAPVLSATSASSISATGATLNFTSNEAGTYYYLVYAAALAVPTDSNIENQGPPVPKGTSSTTASAKSVAVTGLTASTSYKAYVIVKDVAGNKSAVSTIDITTIAAADTTAPVLSATSASSITATGATLNFTSNEAGTYSYLVYAAALAVPTDSNIENQGPPVPKGTSSTTTSAKSVSITGLTASTSYKAYVIVKDVAGNKSLVSTVAFTTAAVVKTSQTITFAEPAAMFVGETQTVTATSTSGLVVTLTAINGAICTVSGYEITAVSAGNCSLRADQDGNSSYLFADNVTQRFVVSAVSTGPSAEEIAAAEAARVAAAAEAARVAAVAEAARVAAAVEAARVAAVAEAARVAAEIEAARVAAVAEAARVAAALIVQAKAELNKLFAAGSAPTIAQYRAAEYTITTQASFDRITAAVAKLPVADRQDATKIAALIKAIEFDESFFNPSAPPSVDTYEKNGVGDVTTRTLPTVNSKVLQIAVEQRSDVVAIQQIATVENFVDQIANPKTRGNVPTTVFVARGLVAADNPHKDALVAAVQGLLAKLDETSVNTLDEIAAIVTRVNAIILKLPVADRTDSSKIAAAILEEAKTALNSVLAGSTPLTIDQLRFANYTITTKASFDRIAAALAKLPVADRQDESKRSALIKAIELDESFFNASVRPNLATYLSYGVTGVTERTLSTVNAQLLLLPVGQRSDLIAIQKIADVENFVDLVANPQTRASATVTAFVNIGLITAENPNKESVVAALKSFDEYSLSTLTKVATAINAINTAVLALAADERSSSTSIAVLSTTLAAKQTFVDRVSNVQTRPSVGSPEFITRKLMPSDTPYKYSVLVGLQGYAETSLDSMDKIAAAIKAEIVKAQQRRALTSKIKASMAAKRGR
jgi:hypothetical protein